MSFSAKIKEELSKINTFSNIDTVKAELYGYVITTSDKRKRYKVFNRK
ncbi:MAG: hypothetical protein HFJ24_05445 [Clostridia bacterium]|nr:hypothetical protein [Clostridia bacterium]MCI9275401.1 hypothetical protein [Clostridia bacterium]